MRCSYLIGLELTERYWYIHIVSSSAHTDEHSSDARAEIEPQSELLIVSSIQKSRKLNTYFGGPRHCAREQNHRRELC